MRIGHVVAAGVLAAVTASFPASLRMGEEGSLGRALEQWLVLSALATPLGILAVAALRRARAGMTLLMGNGAILLYVGVLWWAVIEMGLLGIVGAVLRKTTHHHALAGVTFAVFALASGVIVGLLARRAAMIIARGGHAVLKTGLYIAGAAAFLIVMLVGIKTSRAEGLHTAAGLVDSLALAVTSAIASSRLLARVRPLAIAGVPVAVLVLMVGLTTLRFDPKLKDSLLETAPIHSLVISLFSSSNASH